MLPCERAPSAARSQHRNGGAASPAAAPAPAVQWICQLDTGDPPADAIAAYVALTVAHTVPSVVIARPVQHAMHAGRTGAAAVPKACTPSGAARSTPSAGSSRQHTAISPAQFPAATCGAQRRLELSLDSHRAQRGAPHLTATELK